MCSLNVQTNPYVPSGFYSPCGMVGCQKKKTDPLEVLYHFKNYILWKIHLLIGGLEHDFFSLSIYWECQLTFILIHLYT